MTYIETPRTDAGNATYLSNGHNLENFSVENSFLSPSKRKDDLISQLRNGRGINLKTPRARGPLADLRNLPAAPAQGEFTPLLQSGLRKNNLRKGKLNGVPETPAFLKAGYKSGKSPALPAVEASVIYDYDEGSSAVAEDDGTPIPQVASSSAQSTPLAVLPKRDAGGLLQDQGQMMTLREQENIINKVEKENFGLKLKIHFLEESLRKAGPGFNEAALRENTDLKVDKITMQKELVRAKKTLSQAERDLEAYRLHLQTAQEDLKRRHADNEMREEMEFLRRQVTSKDAEVKELQLKLQDAESNAEALQKCHGDIEDLEADLREKDRVIDERDEENDRLKAQAKKDSEELDEIYEELEAGKKQIEDFEGRQGNSTEQAKKLEEAQTELHLVRHNLQELQGRVADAEAAARTSKEDAAEALDARHKAEDDLEELRDEISNKSMTTKGLGRQLEDKANKLQLDLTGLRQKHAALEECLEDKSREARKAQELVKDAEQDAEIRERRLKDETELIRHKFEATNRKSESLQEQLQQAIKELQIKSEEKDLLHSRHDALTAESQALQKELSKASARVQGLEQDLQEEKAHALDNDRKLRLETKGEIDRLSEEVDNLHRELDDKDNYYAINRDQWESQRQDLEAYKEKAEEKAAGLERTVKKLQEKEGTLSGREMKLQEAIESEHQRHRSEEAVLSRQIEQLNDEIRAKRQTLDDLRAELSRTREELRISKREQATSHEKVQALEDEVEVLQSGFDEEVEQARGAEATARKEVDSLRAQLDSVKKEVNQLEAAHGDFRIDVQSGSMEMRDLQAQLQQTRADKQSMQDRLATINIELHNLRARSTEVEAERDEFKIQLKQMQDQADETFKLDQEKVELRASKLKLESDIGRLREERKRLIEKNEALERELQDEIENAASEEGRLSEEMASLQRKMTVGSEGRDRELLTAKQKVQRLEVQVEDLEKLLARGEHDGEAVEMSMIQKDLSAARKKETELLQREVAHKETIRDLKQTVSRLERQIHEAEVSRLAVDSPKSFIGGSARKNELVESRRQLAEAHQQVKGLRSKSKDAEKDFRRRLSEAERQVQANYDSYKQQREQFEQELSECRLRQEEQAAKSTANEKTINRLRTRIQFLEQSLHTNRASAAGDKTMAEERKDLHDMLKDAKLEAEDLQLQITERQSQIDAASSCEKDLRTQLKRVREERTLYFKKSAAMNKELENVQSQFDRALDKITCQQHEWDEERKAIVSRVRFPNMSISSIDRGESTTEFKQLELMVQEKEKVHQRELRGLAKQIQWMRARCLREEGFRKGLAYEKRFLLMQIEMFNACNKLDLHLLSEIGVTPDRSTPHKRPTIRTVSLVIIAGVRMKKMQMEWAVQKKVQTQLVKKFENVRRESGLRTGSKRFS